VGGGKEGFQVRIASNLEIMEVGSTAFVFIGSLRSHCGSPMPDEIRHHIHGVAGAAAVR
jgi:hypothetical protein